MEYNICTMDLLNLLENVIVIILKRSTKYGPGRKLSVCRTYLIAPSDKPNMLGLAGTLTQCIDYSCYPSSIWYCKCIFYYNLLIKKCVFQIPDLFPQKCLKKKLSKHCSTCSTHTYHYTENMFDSVKVYCCTSLLDLIAYGILIGEIRNFCEPSGAVC